MEYSVCERYHITKMITYITDSPDWMTGGIFPETLSHIKVQI